MNNTPLMEIGFEANNALTMEGRFYFFRYVYNTVFDWYRQVNINCPIDLNFGLDNLNVKERGLARVCGDLMFFYGRAIVLIEKLGKEEDIQNLKVLIKNKLEELKLAYKNPYAEEIKKILDSYERKRK